MIFKVSSNANHSVILLFYDSSVWNEDGWEENMFALNLLAPCNQSHCPALHQGWACVRVLFPLALEEINLVQSPRHWNERQEMLFHFQVCHTSTATSMCFSPLLFPVADLCRWAPQRSAARRHPQLWGGVARSTCKTFWCEWCVIHEGDIYIIPPGQRLGLCNS